MCHILNEIEIVLNHVIESHIAQMCVCGELKIKVLNIALFT